MGTYTVYITTNYGDPYPTPQCASSGTITIGRKPCILPNPVDLCVCANNADVNRRAPSTDGQFETTVSILGGTSPWTLVSLTSGSGKPISKTLAPVDCIDHLTKPPLIPVLISFRFYPTIVPYSASTFSMVIRIH
ncbi:MAG: hypothetical protein IPP29_22995 [Bacteroidetes bacterium]|nr:hypothetical protein [Bacteroidota bacterium]